MNKTYRSVWNESTGTWVAVQENASTRGKRASGGGIAVALGAMVLSV
ncbi:ESPR domain-containing protein [Paraburkholderia bannensis]